MSEVDVVTNRDLVSQTHSGKYSMKVARQPEEYYSRFTDKPVEIRPFAAESKRQSSHYLRGLNDVLAPFGACADLHGSVELEIAGKGEWEFAVWLGDERWYGVLVRLINHFGSIYELTDEFALFNDSYDGKPVEVILMRGETARQNQAVMHYWRTHPEALKDYERGKYRHAHSKREYYRWKDNLIADILESL